MEAVIWIGAFLALLGLIGIILSALNLAKARSAGLEEEALRAKLRKFVAWNMAALLTSALGLGMVVVGVILA